MHLQVGPKISVLKFLTLVRLNSLPVGAMIGQLTAKQQFHRMKSDLRLLLTDEWLLMNI
jgi:hypothetical protein